METVQTPVFHIKAKIKTRSVTDFNTGLTKNVDKFENIKMVGVKEMEMFCGAKRIKDPVTKRFKKVYSPHPYTGAGLLFALVEKITDKKGNQLEEKIDFDNKLWSPQEMVDYYNAIIRGDQLKKSSKVEQQISDIREKVDKSFAEKDAEIAALKAQLQEQEQQKQSESEGAPVETQEPKTEEIPAEEETSDDKPGQDEFKTSEGMHWKKAIEQMKIIPKDQLEKFIEGEKRDSVLKAYKQLK